jgi:glycosyltransferase involved in cell wall biosynthesis
VVEDRPAPLVTVITPTYNRVRWLPEAIESVFAQTLTDFEHIVLDDGSTDDTASLLEEWASREPERFRWTSHENMGQIATVNKGFTMARGQYVFLLNSDDFLYPEALERLVEGLQADPDALAVFSDYRVIDEDGQSIMEIGPSDITSVDIIRQQISVGAGVMYTRRMVEALGGWNPEYTVIPDFEFWIRGALLGRYRHVPGVLAVWRAHPGAVTKSHAGHRSAEEFIRLADWLFAKEDLPEEIRAIEADAYRNLYMICGLQMLPEMNRPEDRFVVVDRVGWELNLRSRDQSVEQELLQWQEHAGRVEENYRNIDALAKARTKQYEVERARSGQLEAILALREQELEVARADAAELSRQLERNKVELESARTTSSWFSRRRR